MPPIWVMQGRFLVTLCGAKTSYPSSLRNYVTQDILRRIMSDYFGYDIHFVMNITDIDDKVGIPYNFALHSSWRSMFGADHSESKTTIPRQYVQIGIHFSHSRITR
jgi:hypothetical protein